MTILILIILLFVCLIFSIWKIVRPGKIAPASIEEWERLARFVDPEVLRILTNPEEDLHLQKYLNPKECRPIQRRRTILALRCTRNMRFNAKLLVGMASKVHSHPDSVSVQTSKRLLSEAIQVEISAFHAEFILLFKWLFPGVDLAWKLRVDHYRTVLDELTKLQQIVDFAKT